MTDLHQLAFEFEHDQNEKRIQAMVQAVVKTESSVKASCHLLLTRVSVKPRQGNKRRFLLYFIVRNIFFRIITRFVFFFPSFNGLLVSKLLLLFEELFTDRLIFPVKG